MDFNKLFGFFKILKVSILLLPRNGKVMAIIAILSILLSYLVYFSLTFSVNSLTQGMLDIEKSMIPDPSSSTPALTPSQLADLLDRIRKYMMLLYAVEIAFVIVFFIISFFITLATIMVSAISYSGNFLSIKDFFSTIASLTMWKRPFVTSISVAIHALGYFLAVGTLIAPAILYQNVITLLIAVFVGIAAFVIYLYLLVVWILAVVVSVIAEENCYGMVAMGKAATLVKGQRLNGYMLNLFFALLGLIISLVFQVIVTFAPNSTFYVVSVTVIFGSLVKILQLVAYTLFYFHCKYHHGENTEIDGMVKYDILPTTLSH